jgi:hypothetical protein
MAAGAILRVAGIYAAAQVLFSLGWLNHVTAALVLILGFVIECLVVVQAALRPPSMAAFSRGRKLTPDTPAQNGQAEREKATAKM